MPVGSTYTNPFGLSEMHGNVCERCIDARIPGKFVVRGGDFILYIVWHRSAARHPDMVGWESNTGFRVVRQLK